MKKLLAICFGLVLCFALGVTAMAAEFTVTVDYWSTLNNASVEDSYEVLKTKVTTALCKDASVQILDSDGNVLAQADTNANGVATFNEKPTNAAKIIVSRSDCMTKTVEIPSGNTANVTLERPVLKVVSAEGSTGRFVFRYSDKEGIMNRSDHIVLWDVDQQMNMYIDKWGWTVIFNVTSDPDIGISTGHSKGGFFLTDHTTITVETMGYGKIAHRSNFDTYFYSKYLTFYTPNTTDVHDNIGYSGFGEYRHHYLGTYDLLVSSPSGYYIDAIYMGTDDSGRVIAENVNASTYLIEDYVMQEIDGEGIEQNIYVEYKQYDTYVNVTASNGGTVTTKVYPYDNENEWYSGTAFIPIDVPYGNLLNDNVTIKAVADAGYYIKSIIVKDGNGNILENITGDATTTTKEFVISTNDNYVHNITNTDNSPLHGKKEYEVYVTFGNTNDIKYRIWLYADGRYGTVKANPSTLVTNGSDVTVEVNNIKSGKTVDYITVKKDGAEESTREYYYAYAKEGTYQYTVDSTNRKVSVTINDVDGDYSVRVVYKDVETVSLSDNYVTIDATSEEIGPYKIWEDPNSNTYYTNGAMVRLCSTADGKRAGVEKIRVTGGEYTYLDPDTYNYTYRILNGEVDSVELYYKAADEPFKEWHLVTDWQPFSVVLDEDSPKVEVTFDHAEYGTENINNKVNYLYSRDAGKIQVTVKVTDIGSGLKNARYVIYDGKDGKQEVQIENGTATFYIDPNNHETRAVLQVYAEDNTGNTGNGWEGSYGETAIFERYIIFTDKLSVSYDANGGTGAVTDGNYDPGATETVISADAFACEGYRFVEWNTDPEGKGTSYNPGDTFIVNASVTLYAIWEKIPEETKPEPEKPEEPCNHRFDKNGKCTECNIIVIDYAVDTEKEQNPNTGAPVISGIAALAILVGAVYVFNKK